MTKFEYRTTIGNLIWDDQATTVESADDPIEPGDKILDVNWELIGSGIGALRHSKQPILWFWRREIKS